MSPTEAGARLLRGLGPALDTIRAELASLSELREKPAGTIRITAGEHAAQAVVWPALARLLPDFPDIKAVVGAPAYFARRPPPRTPQDLTGHDCINMRLPTYGGIYAWEFEQDRRELKVRVEGQLVFNNLALRLAAALAGIGLAYLPEDHVRHELADGRLVRVLAD